MSSVINVEEDTMGMRIKNPRPLMSQLSMHLMILFHQLQKPRKCTLSSSPSVKSSLSSTAKSNSYCFLCKRPGPKLVNVPPKARFFFTFLHNEIIIPAGSRCCPVHLHEDLFTDEAMHKWHKWKHYSQSDFNTESIEKLENCSIAQWNISN